MPGLQSRLRTVRTAHPSQLMEQERPAQGLLLLAPGWDSGLGIRIAGAPGAPEGLALLCLGCCGEEAV